MGTKAGGIRPELQGTTSSPRRRRARIALAASLALFALAASASPAGASVPLGQLAPGISPPGYLDGLCGGPVPGDYLQQTVISGNSYVVPGPGVITSWSHNAGDGSGMTLTFKVFRHFGGALFTAVGHSGPFPLLPSKINTFPANIAVTTGDIIGLRVPTATPGVACDFEAPAEVGELTTGSDLADGQSGTFAPSSSSPTFGYRVNITAVFEPSNTVTVGKTKLNKKKGTATLNLTLPNPGELVASGKGVKATSVGRAVSSKAVGAGPATLLIRAKGKQRKKLNATGKVKLKVAITYTPTGGNPATQSKQVKLKKK